MPLHDMTILGVRYGTPLQFDNPNDKIFETAQHQQGSAAVVETDFMWAHST
jgi:hypothetical protein